MGLKFAQNFAKKDKKEPNKRVQWIKFGIVTFLYLLFLLWLGSWMGLIVVPFIYDIYITKKIKWQWWKDSTNASTRFIMSWVDALVFALVAVYFINLFFFQNFVIPSSSLEKSLLTGDYLCVSKLSYGPRIPNTPLTMPLTQHTLPILGCKSYIEWPQWDYRRAPGLGSVELNDIVVFNYPAGDSICSVEQYQTMYYQLCYENGAQAYLEKNHPEAFQNLMGRQVNIYGLLKEYTKIDSLSYEQQSAIDNEIYSLGRQIVQSDPQKYGVIGWRPVDRRENYVKRCVGLPGMTLQIKDHIVYLDGKANKEPDNVQYTYHVEMQMGKRIPQDLLDELGITNEDLTRLNSEDHDMPMTKHTYDVLSKRTDLVKSITPVVSAEEYMYPYNGHYGWTRDNYGPIWIPKKGSQIPGGLNLKNLAIYERPIRVYEHNDLQVKDGKILINGKEATNYTFQMDYYWMQGDNRHCSADSRYWGFVPEDHIVGKPLFIWWSSSPDKSFFGGIRWSRLFTWVDNIK